MRRHLDVRHGERLALSSLRSRVDLLIARQRRNPMAMLTGVTAVPGIDVPSILTREHTNIVYYGERKGGVSREQCHCQHLV